MDVTGDRVRVLRLGGVSAAEIGAVTGGPVDVFGGVTALTEAAASPGQHARHYSPRTPAVRFDAAGRADAIRRYGDRRTVVLDVDDDDPAGYARRLYARLRAADAAGADVILVEMPPATPAWAAVRDRLTRATVALPV